MREWIERIALSILALWLLIAAIVAGVVLFLYVQFQSFEERPHLTDEALIENLRENMDQYNLLIEMFAADYPLTTVHPHFIRPDHEISAERWEEYQKIFRELELDAGMRYGPNESIWFISTTHGLMTGGSIKGYVYRPKTPTPLYTSLNSIPDDLKSNVYAFKKINEEWFISFYWDD